jgi:integrase
MKPRKRGQFWEARWTRADGSEGTYPGFLTEQEAKDFGDLERIQAKKDRRAGIYDKKSKEMTLFQYINESYAKGLNVKNRTAEDYEINLNKHILPKFGKYPLSKITPEELDLWRRELTSMTKENGNKYSFRTLEKIENQLATILKKAVRDDYLGKNPFDKMDRSRFKKKIVKHKVKVLEFDQLVTIANRVPAHLELLVWLGYYTGMRPSELLGLTWDRINFDDKKITIDRQIHHFSSEVFDYELKSQAAYREIYLHELLEEKLLEHRRKFGLGPQQLLFKNRDGNVLRYKAALHAFTGAARPIGIPIGKGMHILRHSSVSAMLAAGVKEKDVQVWVGHASFQETVDTYGHLFEDSQKIAADKMVVYFKAQLEKNRFRAVRLA